MDGPMKTFQWCGYFEDIPSVRLNSDQCSLPPVSERGNWHVQNMSRPAPPFMEKYLLNGTNSWHTCNYNQYSPLETARYMLTKKTDVDSQWKEDATQLVEFVRWALSEDGSVSQPHVTPAVQWGAHAVSEQWADQLRMVSHTSRYASVMAQLAEETGNRTLGATARRSWDWSSYMSDDRGRVVVGPVDQSIWFSDGYGDFIRNTLHMMAANASWAPEGESHILRSSSTVTSVEYRSDSVAYTLFDARESVEKLALAFRPTSVTADGIRLRELEHAQEGSGQLGWSFGGASQRELIVRHEGHRVVVSR